MAKLYVRTHDGSTFELDVEEAGGVQSGALNRAEWVQFEGTDGKRLTLHSKTIHSILRDPRTPA